MTWMKKSSASAAPSWNPSARSGRSQGIYPVRVCPSALEKVSETRFRFEFLASPTGIVGDEQGNVAGLEVEDTTLVWKDGDTKARGLGTRRVVDCDTVIFCIGDKVDENFGLPINKWNEFVKNPSHGSRWKRCPTKPSTRRPTSRSRAYSWPGWSREASSGLVGIARKDGEFGARAAFKYLEGVPPASNPEATVEALMKVLRQRNTPTVTYDAIQQLEAVEQAERERLGWKISR